MPAPDVMTYSEKHQPDVVIEYVKASLLAERDAELARLREALDAIAEAPYGPPGSDGAMVEVLLKIARDALGRT